MSAVTITIAVGSVVCAGIALIVFVQAREKAKLEKLRRVTALNDRYNTIQAIISGLPGQYMDNVLRILLREQSIHCVRELNGLKPSPRHAEFIAEDEQKIQEIKEGKSKAIPVKIDSTEQARDIRTHLQNLYKLLHLWHRRATISPEHAQHYMAHVGFLARQSKADLFAEKAKQAEVAGKPRVAIHNYHSAVEVLKEVANNPVAAQNISAYRGEMARLNKVADKRTEELKAKAQQDMESNDEWNEFLGDDDEWKKKNDYDES